MKMIFARTFAAIGLLFLSAGTAQAASVASFTATPSASNAYPVSFTWSVSGGSSGTLSLASCPTGVSVKTSGGAELCQSNFQVTGSSGSDYVTVYNVSGGSKTINLAFTAKDNEGVLTTDSITYAQVSIGAVSQPITDFSVAASSITSGGTQTLTWTGVYIPGVNFQFDCNNDLTVSAGGTQLACGVPAFTSDLAASGSQTITVVNKSRSDTALIARILPAMAAGAYDATHALQTAFNVAPAGVASSSASQTPSVSSFTASSTTVASGGAIDLTWATQNASGANIMFTCDSPVRITTLIDGATTTLVCNSNAFAAPLAAAGTLRVSVANSNYYPQVFGATLLPQDANGIYLSQYAKVVSLSVLQPGASLTAPTPAPQAAVATVPTSVSAHAPITKPLWKGITDPQVKTLQQFLAANPAIYPLGLVSGYFGSATEGAVQKFQIKYALAKPGDSGYGFVGPMTRAKINSLVTP